MNKFEIQPKRLWRDHGRAVVADIAGSAKYLYDDGTVDLGSIVDVRVEHARAEITEQQVAVLPRDVPNFVKERRLEAVFEAFNGVPRDRDAKLRLLGARALHLAPESNIIAFSLPETATGNDPEDQRLDNVA